MPTILLMFHFILLYSLEMKVKKLILLKEKNQDEHAFCRKRRLLFLIIFLLAISPLLLALLDHFIKRFTLPDYVRIAQASSMIFGIYYCICKLGHPAFKHMPWMITVPSSKTSDKTLAVLSILLIVSVFTICTHYLTE